MRIKPMPNADRKINAIIDAVNATDPLALNEFITFGLEAYAAHIDIIRPTLSEQELSRRYNVLCQANVLLSLVSYFGAKKTGQISDGFGIDQVGVSEG